MFFQELCEEMCSAEVLYIQIRSLEHKFSLSQDLPTEVIREFAYRLLTESVVPVPGGWAGPLAVTIKNLFVATAKVTNSVITIYFLDCCFANEVAL